MRLIPEIIGYDVVNAASGGIVAFSVPTRDEAEQAASSVEGSFVVPVMKSSSRRTGYAIRQQAAAE